MTLVEDDIMSGKIQKKTAQQIVETVKDVCGQDVNFIDRRGEILASTDEARIGSFHEIGQQVIKTETTIEVKEDNSFYGTYQGVNMPISHNQKVIGAIGITGNPEQVRKYAYLAQKITMLLLREQDLEHQTSNLKNKMNYMVRSFISKEMANPGYLEEFLTEHQIRLEDRYVTVLVALDSRYNPSNLSMIERKIYQAFEKCGSEIYTFQYPGEYIALIPEDSLIKRYDVLQKVAASHLNLLKIGIGNGQTLAKQYRSYGAAQLTLRSLNKTQNISKYDELDLEIVLASVSTEVKERFLEKTISKLSEEDIQLLRMYYSEDMSLAKTSQRLFLHKNTLQYKLDRISRLCGYNPRHFKDAVVLCCALKL